MVTFEHRLANVCVAPALTPALSMGVSVAEMDRRSMMLMTGIAALAAAIPVATPGRTRPHTGGSDTSAHRAAGCRYREAILFADEFDGPAGSAPDPAKWTVFNWDEPVTPPILGHYRDDRRNVFLDGNSNLVICATQEGPDYYSGKIQSNWKGAIGHTWEAR